MSSGWHGQKRELTAQNCLTCSCVFSESADEWSDVCISGGAVRPLRSQPGEGGAS